MKLFAYLAAGLCATAALAPAVSAQHHRVVRHTVVRHHVVRHRARRHRVVCNTNWYHHRRVRRCRTVYY